MLHTVLKKWQKLSTFFSFFPAFILFIPGFCLAIDSHVLVKDSMSEFILEGNWDFYWHEFIVKEGYGTKAPVNTEFKPWNRNGFPKFGYGSYRLVLTTEIPKIYGMKIPYQAGAYELYINNKLVSKNGRIGKSKTTSMPELKNIYTEVYLSEVNEIVLQVSNFHKRYGGAARPITIFSDKNKMQNVLYKHLTFYAFILGILVYMAIYQLFLYLFRRSEKATLYLALFCISLATGILFGSRELYSFIQLISLHWLIQQKVVYSTVCINTIAMYLFFKNSYNEVFPPIPDKIIKISFLLITGSILALYPPLFGQARSLMTIWVMIVFIYIFFILIRSVIKKAEYSLLFASGFSIIFLTLTVDVVMTFVVSPLPYITPIGLCIFLVFQSVAISAKFSKSFIKVEKQSNELSLLSKIKDDFLANTSHELKTPLNGIMGIAESILDFDDEELKSRLNENIKIILNNSRRLSYLVNDLLDRSALKRGSISIDLVSVKLFDIVEQSRLLFSAKLKQKNIEFFNRVDPQLLNVLADPVRLQQILNNLVDNAVKYTDCGRIIVKATQHDGKIKVAVSDTGKGIDSKFQARVFEAFEKSDSSPGTGLGLTITSDLVKLHGSKVELESVPGKGSVFSFYLKSSPDPSQIALKELAQPISDENEVTTYNSGHDQVLTSNTAPSLLIVDDELLNLQILKNHLKKYSILEAESGEKALNLLEKQTPDLILLDIMMPGLNGIETCQRIRQRLSQNELPIIFLTAKNRITDLKNCFEVGGNDYLPKPYFKGELLSRVENQLETLRGIRHLSDINFFANSISNVRDTEDMARELFDYVKRIPSIAGGFLSNEGRKIAAFGDEKSIPSKETSSSKIYYS